MTLQGTSQAQVEDSVPGPPGEVPETLVSHGSVMFMESREEMTARIKYLVGVLREAVENDLPERFLVGDCFHVYWRILTGEQPARVAPMRLTSKQAVDLTQVKAKPRLYPPEKSAWLNDYFELLDEMTMVCLNPKAFSRYGARSTVMELIFPISTICASLVL